MFSVIVVNVFKNKLSLAEKKPVAGKQPLNSIVWPFVQGKVKLMSSISTIAVILEC